MEKEESSIATGDINQTLLAIDVKVIKQERHVAAAFVNVNERKMLVS